MSGALEKVNAARLRVSFHYPYYSSALWAVNFIEAPCLTAAADENWRVYYDPDFIGLISVEETATVLIHEIQHLLRDHCGRCRGLGARPDVWNLAADMEINDDLIKEKLKFPHIIQPITPGRFGFKDELVAEKYYDLLMKKKSDKDGSISVPIMGPPGDEQKSKSKTDGQGNPSEQNSELSQSGSSQNREPGVMSGRCGSAANGKPEPWELDGTANGTRKIGNTESELIRNQVAKDIVEYHTRTRGSVPSGLERWARARLKPKINWEAELRSQIRHSFNMIAGKIDYSYAKPSRKQEIRRDIIFPSLVAYKANVAVVIDTSGSVSDYGLDIALTETKAIIRQLSQQSSVTVSSCDAAASKAKKVFNVNQIKLYGGGGTDMGIGIEEVCRAKPRPDIIVVLTDGYTPWPSKKPKGIHLIIGLIGAKRKELEVGSCAIPPWAKVVEIPSKD